MKVRNGFVSNSSSSSFVLVGVSRWSNKDIAEKLLKALGFTEENFDEADEDIMCPQGFEVADQGEFFNKINKISLFVVDNEISCVGINIKNDLEAGKTVDEMKKELVNKAKALGVKIKVTDIKFLCQQYGW